jgi:PPP family 3-phenylpropionic acid transporter
MSLSRRVSPSARASMAYATYFAGIGAAFPYLPVYYRSLGLDLGLIGALAAVSALVGLLSSPIWGALADRFPHSRLILPLAALGSAVGVALLSVADSAPAVVLSVVLFSSAAGGVAPTLDSRALEAVREDRDRYGRLRAWGSLSFIVASWVVGLLIDRAGVHVLFLCWIPALLLTAAVGLTLPPGEATHPSARVQTLRRVLRERAIVRFLPAALLVWSANMAVNSFFSLHLLGLGASAGLVGLAWAFGALVEIPLMWAFPAMAARIRAERLLILGGALFALRAVAMAVITAPVVVVALMAVHGAAFALFVVGGVTYVSRRAPTGTAATAQGVFTSTWGLGMILGSGLGGQLAGAVGIGSMYAVAAAVGAAGVVALVLALRPYGEVVPGDQPSPVVSSS